MFYESDDPRDKWAAVKMAEPYFTSDNDAAGIIADASSRRYGVDSELAREANTIIYNSIEMYINRLIHDKFNSYVSTGDYSQNAEMTQILHSCAMEQVLNDIGQYDKKRAKPITYMHRSILYGMSQYIMSEKMGAPSRAYGLQMKRVYRVVDELKKKGISPTVPEIKLSVGNELSEEQISNALRLLEIHSTMQSWDEIDEKQAAFDTPEEALIKKDNHEELLQALGMLEEDERQIICLTFGVDPYTFESVSNGENQKTIADILKISQDVVKRKKIIGLNKMRSYYQSGTAAIRMVNDEYTDRMLCNSNVPFLSDDDDDDLITLCQSVIAITPKDNY